MRVHVLSDLHLEFADYRARDVEADLVVLAGDIGVGPHGLRWAMSAFGQRPVVRMADYLVGDTRVISNPRGYPDSPGDGFDPGLVIDVDEGWHPRPAGACAADQHGCPADGG